ncbi:MAG: ABC transporter permease subunit [Coriobacteriales bacterium]|jgi:ABC-2 type transport system permease protein|nr:ABC transporter permease subunit [Coriobacteriales bacterium]
MISATLLKQTIRENFALWLVIALVQALLLVIMGLTVPNVAMTALTYYQLLPSILIGIYVIIIGNNLLSQQVDRGTMAYVLSTPIRRTSVSATQMVFFVGSLLLMFVLGAAAHIFAMNFSEAGITTEDVELILKLNIGLFTLALAFSGIVFCASSIFNLSKHTIAVGGGLVAAFLLLPIVAMFSEEFNWIKDLSIASLYDPMLLATGAEGFVWKFVVLAAIGIAAYGVGTVVFARRDLPL